MISIIGSPAQFSQQLLGGVSGQPGNNGSYAPDTCITIYNVPSTIKTIINCSDNVYMCTHRLHVLFEVPIMHPPRSVAVKGIVACTQRMNIIIVYLLIYRTLLITPDTLLGNFRCSNTTHTPVL